MNKIIGSILVVMMAGVSFAGMDSKSDTEAAASAQVVFGPKDTANMAKYVYAKSGDSTAELKFFQRSGSGKALTAAATNGATVLAIANTGTSITNSDYVCVVYANGAEPLFTTVSAATTTNITLNSAVTQACTTADKVYEVTASTLSIGTTAFNSSADVVFVTPPDSPLVIQVTGATNQTVLSTVQW